MTEDLTDREIISKCLDDSDEAAWEFFVRKYSSRILNTVQKTFFSYQFRYFPEDTEDVSCSVMLSLVDNDFRKLRQFRSENSASLLTWLTVVTVRMTIDYMRRDKRHLVADSYDLEQDPLALIQDKRPRPDALLEEKRRREMLVQSIDSLAPEDRVIIELLYNRDVGSEEAARLLGVSAAHIYSRKHRITEKIKKNINAL